MLALLGRRPSGGYSQRAGLFLHGHYDLSPEMPARETTSPSTLAARLADKRVLVCVGAGGVGKTTTSAALALGLALRGKRVAVVTIDPAKRLASALGLADLSGEPHRIDTRELNDAGGSSQASCGR